jgi:hypothetical protein
MKKYHRMGPRLPCRLRPTLPEALRAARDTHGSLATSYR